MTKFLRRWLLNDFLEVRDGRYEGRIARVVEEQVHNKYKLRHDPAPVIEFADGVSWIPNQRCLKTLLETLGQDNDDWIDRWLRVSLKPVTKSGRTKLEKFVEVLDADPREEAAWS